MKTITSMLLGLGLLVAGAAAFTAQDPPKTEKSKVKAKAKTNEKKTMDSGKEHKGGKQSKSKAEQPKAQ